MKWADLFGVFGRYRLHRLDYFPAHFQNGGQAPWGCQGVITRSQLCNEREAWLLHTVENQARQWNLKTPEVAIYSSPEPKLLPPAPAKTIRSVAVSTGLINSMTRDEVEAVLAHQMAHVGNGDMVTLTPDSRRGQHICGVFGTHRFRHGGPQRQRRSVARHLFIVSLVLQIVFGFFSQLYRDVVQPPA